MHYPVTNWVTLACQKLQPQIGWCYRLCHAHVHHQQSCCQQIVIVCSPCCWLPTCMCTQVSSLGCQGWSKPAGCDCVAVYVAEFLLCTCMCTHVSKAGVMPASRLWLCISLCCWAPTCRCTQVSSLGWNQTSSFDCVSVYVAECLHVCVLRCPVWGEASQ